MAFSLNLASDDNRIEDGGIGELGMLTVQKTVLVLVAAKENLLNKLTAAFADTNLAILHAETQREAITLLEKLNSDIDLAIIQLESAELGARDLIDRLIQPSEKPLKIIATTSLYPEKVRGMVGELGVDDVVAEAMSPAEWRKTVQCMLLENKTLQSVAR